MKLLKRISVWLLPLLILLLVSGLFILKQLHNIETLPTKGWSRSIPLPMDHMDDQAKLFTQKQGGSVTIYGKTSKGISEVSLSPSFHVDATKTYPVHPDSERVWGKGQTLIYIKNGKLIQYHHGTAKALASHVSNFLPFEDQIIYLSDNTLMKLNPSTGAVKKIGSFNLPVSELNKSANNQDFVASVSQGSMVKVYYFKKEGNDYHKALLHTFNEPSVQYSGFLFSVKPDSIQLLYSRTSYGGGSSTTNFVAEINKKSWTTKQYSVYTAASHDPLQNLNDLNYSVINGKDILTFADNGTLSYHHTGQIVYTAPLNGNIALASPHSTNNLSIKPAQINADLIVWLGYEKGNSYQLYAASTNDQAIAKSLNTTKQDIGQAVSNGLMLLSINFFVIFVAFAYALLAIVYYFICYFVNTSAVDNNARFVRVGTYFVFFVSQFLFLYTFLIPKLIVPNLPGYLSFSGSAYIFAVVSALITGLITRYVKTEYWEMFPEIIYFIIVDTLFITFLFGAYTF